MKIQPLILEDIAKRDILDSQLKKEHIKKFDITTQKIYARLKDAKFTSEGIAFLVESEASFDTYQNSFSCGKWAKYTVIDEVAIELTLLGHFEISLMHAYLKNKKVVKECIRKEEVNMTEAGTIQMSFGKLKDEGIVYPVLYAIEEGAKLYQGAYVTADKPKTQEVKLAIDICTFKREQYVKRNMEIMKKSILNNPESPCYGNIWIHISDNASSLEGIVDSDEHITVDKNANLGGVGGFTRGIIETMKRAEERFTHVLLMDDDATISAAAVEANYLLLSYLKEEYFGHTIGGKLLVLDMPFVQFEVGAQWNAGAIKALKNGKDIRQLEQVLKSEVEDDYVEYEGWWYSCIPLKEIGEDNLPLPIFIHRDDIEYGLRVGKGRFIFLNKICIWHESFAGKMPGVLDYYDIRNLAITNAIHCPEYTKKEFKRFVTKWMLGNIVKYRYQYLAYNYKAVEDFCKGIDWLLNQDGLALHQELFSMNYKMKPVGEYAGEIDLDKEELETRREEGYYEPKFLKRWMHKLTLNGYFLPAKSKTAITAPYGSAHTLFRRGKTIVIDRFDNAMVLNRSQIEFFKGLNLIMKARRMIDKKFDQATASYHSNYGKLTSEEFWNRYLGI